MAIAAMGRSYGCPIGAAACHGCESSYEAGLSVAKLNRPGTELTNEASASAPLASTVKPYQPNLRSDPNGILRL